MRASCRAAGGADLFGGAAVQNRISSFRLSGQLKYEPPATRLLRNLPQFTDAGPFVHHEAAPAATSKMPATCVPSPDHMYASLRAELKPQGMQIYMCQP